jgi:hypothetical protein
LEDDVTDEMLAEWLGKLGPAGTWGPPTSRGTSPARWNQADLAAALGRLEPAWVGNLLLWCYADIGNAARLAEEMLYELALEDMPHLRAEQTREFLVIALWELRMGFLCDACKGTGGVIEQNKPVTCPDCAGTGQSQKLSKRRRATLYRVSPSTWNRRHDEPYMRIYRSLRARMQEGLVQLKKRLR